MRRRTVTYAKFSDSPFIKGEVFSAREEQERGGVTFYDGAYGDMHYSKQGVTPYAEFLVNGMDIADARLKWYMNRPGIVYTVKVYVNGQLIESRQLPTGFLQRDERIEATALGDLKASDIVRLEVIPEQSGIQTTVAACLEYTKADVETRKLVVKSDGTVKAKGEADPALTWSIAEGTLFDGDALQDITVSREPGEQPGKYAIRVSQPRGANPRYAIRFVSDSLRIFNGRIHPHSLPTLSQFGYMQKCVEDAETGTLYDYDTREVLDPIDAVAYTKLPENPFYETNAPEKLTLKESAEYMGSYFNWAYETKYGADDYGIRIVRFKVSGNKSVNISEGITTIGNYVFSDCRKLTTVDIPSGIVSIGERAFSNCRNLSSLNIPVSVTSIGNYAFYDCHNVSDINVWGTPAAVSARTFNGMYSDKCVVHVPTAYLQTYKDTPVWNYFKYIVEYNPNEDTFLRGKMGDNVYYEWNMNTGHARIYGTGPATSHPLAYTGIKSVTIEDGVTSLDINSFAECPYLTSVQMASSITKTGSYLFYKCPNLRSVVLSQNLTEISNDSFNTCSSITNINIPSGVTKIGDDAFNNCNALVSLNLPEGVTEIPERMCLQCSSLKSVTIPSTVTKIKESAFENCSSLTSINLPQGITVISKMMCKETSSLTSVVIPEGVTLIDNYAFIFAKKLHTLKLPSSLTSIGESAFEGCLELSEVYVAATTPPSVGDSGFYQVDFQNCTLYVPTGCADAYRNADYWKLFKNIVEHVPTGIRNVSTTTDGNTYDLQGQRINGNAKGIVITNGKKILR